MSLERILQKIEEDAHLEVEKIIQESQKRAEEIKEEARKEGSLISASFLKIKEREARLEASRLVTQARLEGRIKLLGFKKRLIDEVLERAFQGERLREKGLKKEVILKDGKREESFDEEKLKEELRPHLEGFIAKVLKI